MKLSPKTYIEFVLKRLGVKYEREYRFNMKRRYRFDFAIPELMIAIEYEGIFSQKSRHTNIIGYSNDTEKYNLAILDGWKVLRYTAKTFETVDMHLNILMNQNEKSDH